MEGTRHRGDKGVDLEHQVLCVTSALLGDRRGAREGRSGGSHRCVSVPNVSKASDEAGRVGKLASSSERPISVRNATGRGDGTGTKSVGSYPWRSAGVLRKQVGTRTQEQVNRRPCRSRTGAQYPESSRKAASTPWHATEGRESVSGEGGGSKLDDNAKQDSKSSDKGESPWTQPERTRVYRERRCHRDATRPEPRARNTVRHAYAVDHVSKAERGALPEVVTRRPRVVNRPVAGVITRRPEEPYVKGTSTVL